MNDWNEILNNIRTIQVNSPHETQPEPEHHTNTHHTPQPSTPIKHAGSDIWEGCGLERIGMIRKVKKDVYSPPKLNEMMIEYK